MSNPTTLRPDPDALLASLHAAEAQAKRGHLKVFLGMCPGVGKTYAMLRAAHQEKIAGVDVVVAIVETHGRAETHALLAGLEVLPRVRVPYRGTELEELDLEGLRLRSPALVLVDELAHTNAPGLRHAKRWQDVVEILNAGIDVLTTLNIQHVESRADAVRQITGSIQRETVPDSILDLADEIELVDLTPETLLERLKAGKVYLGDRATVARDNFFQESHLAALRELALRYTAERVDRQLRQLRSTVVKSTVWRSGERLLVAVGPSPFSTQLVRWTRRLAAAQGAAWLAVHVESDRPLDPESQKLLDANLALARELGAEVAITQGEDIAEALVRTALQHNATQIVVGKPRAAWWAGWIPGTSLVDRVIRLGGNIDIYVVPSAETGRPLVSRALDHRIRSSAGEYGIAASAIAALTLATLLLPEKYYLAAGLLFLLAIILLSLRMGRGPVLLAAVLSALTWNFVFIPPRFTFRIGAIEDSLLYGTYFVVALVAGQLTARIRAQAHAERLREGRATALFQLTRALAEARTLDEAVFAALRQMDTLFAAKSAILLADAGETLTPHFASSFAMDAKEREVAAWVFRNRKPAGRFTDTLPGVSGFYLPLVREDRAVGVLGLVPGGGKSLVLAQRDLLEAFARQLALSVEREFLREAGEREKLLAKSETLHRVLLDSVSHELRTPLAVITGSLENLSDAAEPLRTALIEEARSAAKRLNRVVGNLLDQTRLESGTLRPRLDWCDARDLVNAALESVRDELKDRPVDVRIPEIPPLRADFALVEQSLVNLLLNAARHTPEKGPIRISAGIAPDGQRVFFSVADAGPGLPPELRERIFRKFERGTATRTGGLGLGLSLVKGFIATQGGDITVDDNPGGGAVFTIYLPRGLPQSPPEE